MSTKTKTAPNGAAGAGAPPEPVTYRINPEVEAKIDSHIQNNPKNWTYLQTMPRDRLERTVVLNEVRQIERQQRMREGMANLREDLIGRQDTSGDRFRIELDKQVLDNRGIAGELLLRRAEKTKTRFGEDIRIGRFAGFDMFIRSGFNNSAELVLRGKNSYSSRVTDTALGTIRSLESEVQGFEERAARLETDIRDSRKRGGELEAKVGTPFEKEERYHHLVKRQSEIEDQLDLTKNQAPNQLEAAENTEAIVEGEQPDKNEPIKPKPARRMKV